MAEVFSNAPVSGRDTPVSILLARVIDVDMKKHTATIRTEGAKRRYADVPFAYPYAHHERGEGFYVVPDVGALCWIATEGSSGSPFILGFSNLPKVASSSERADPDAAPQPEDELEPSYGYRRPQRVPGEFGFTSRDGSFLHFRRGGIVELGGGGACQRLFLPIRNLITDVSENFQQWTAAGRLIFDTDRREGETGETASAKWRLLVKAGAKDTAASILLEAGKLGDNRYHLAIKENVIDLADGACSGADYEFTADLSGNVTETAVGTVTRTCGQLDLTVNGSMSETVHGDRTTQVDGSWVVNVPGGMTVGGGRLTVEDALTTPFVVAFGGIDVNLISFLSAVYNAHTHAPGSTPVPQWTP